MRRISTHNLISPAVCQNLHRAPLCVAKKSYLPIGFLREESPTPNRLQIQPLANPFVRSLPVLHKQVAAFLLAAKGKVGRGTRCPSLITEPQLHCSKTVPLLRSISNPEPPASTTFGKKQGVILSRNNPSRRLYHCCEGSPCGNRLQI